MINFVAGKADLINRIVVANGSHARSLLIALPDIILISNRALSNFTVYSSSSPAYIALPSPQ